MTNISNRSYSRLGNPGGNKFVFNSILSPLERLKSKINYTFVQITILKYDDYDLNKVYEFISKDKYIMSIVKYRDKFYDVFSEILNIERTEDKIIIDLKTPDMDYAIKNGLAFESIENKSIH